MWNLSARAKILSLQDFANMQRNTFSLHNIFFQNSSLVSDFSHSSTLTDFRKTFHKPETPQRRFRAYVQNVLEWDNCGVVIRLEKNRVFPKGTDGSDIEGTRTAL